MAASREVRINIFCSAAERNGLKAVAALEGKNLTQVIHEMIMDKVGKYPEIYENVISQYQQSQCDQTETAQQ